MRSSNNTVKALPAETRLKLTHREHEILELIATGAAQKEIADHLEISRFTVDVHIKNIKLKTGLQKATELAAAYFTSRYHLPVVNIPRRTRRAIAAALVALSLFGITIQHTRPPGFFSTAPARRGKNDNYLPLNHNNMKRHTLIYAYLFLAIAVITFIAFVMGHQHQGALTIITGAFSRVLFYEARKKANNKTI